MLVETVWLDCPYCGERQQTGVDCSAGNQSYIEDCQVCCRPIEISICVNADGSLAQITTRRDDD
jgi:hypothetical protein